MSKSIKDLAKERMLEAKRKVKEEEKKAKEELKNKQLEEKAKRKEKEDYYKRIEEEKKEFATRVKKDILYPHYKNKGDTYIAKDLYITKFEDGNIFGKNKDEYFYSYQKDNVTYIKTFSRAGKRRINDGDHYPTFATVDVYKTSEAPLNISGKPIISQVKIGECMSYSFWAGAEKEIQEFKKLDEIANKVDELTKTLNNNVPR